MLSACEDHGFFYLDLRDWESGKVLLKLEETWRIMKPWFDQPLAEKLKTETISNAHGWDFIPSGLLVAKADILQDSSHRVCSRE